MTTLNEHLDEHSVSIVDDYHITGVYSTKGENISGLKGWYMVVTPDNGAVAYFVFEQSAFFYRLALINAKLNKIAS